MAPPSSARLNVSSSLALVRLSHQPTERMSSQRPTADPGRPLRFVELRPLG
jgi:hypothetical protein